MDDTKTTAVSGDDALLAGYLLERDAACPLCGYNLRSFTKSACPECGAKLELGLHDPNPLWRRRGLLLFLFAWLVLAGGMNTARAARDIHRSFHAPRLFYQTLLAPVTPPGATLLAAATTPVAPLGGMEGGIEEEAGDEGDAAARPPQAEVDVTVAAPAPAIVDAQTQVIIQQTSGTLLRRVIAQQPAMVNVNQRTGWANVSALEWTRASGWGSLATIAAFGLFLLIRYRRRPAPARTARLLTGIAWVAFSGYFLAHAVLFVRTW